MSPSARRAVARFALSRGLSRRRAAWLCTTPRSGMEYRSVRARQDRWLSAALRIVAREDPSWATGWPVAICGCEAGNSMTKGISAVALEWPVIATVSAAAARYVAVTNWRDLQDTVTTFGPGILCMIAMAMQNRFVVLLSRMRQPAIVWRSRLAGTYNISTSKPR